MSVCKRIVTAVCPIPKVEQYERFLFIGPHPDDIEIGAGATVSKLTSNGKQVSFLICTDGRFGTDNLDAPVTPEELIEIRKKEELEAAAELDVQSVDFLGLSDGGMYSEEDLKNGILKKISSFHPDVIFAPDPNVPNESHPDHLNVGNAVKRLSVLLNNPGIMQAYGFEVQSIQAVCYYMTANYNAYVRTSSEHLHRQLNSIKKHASQYPCNTSAEKALRAYLTIRSSMNGIKVLASAAEGFRVLGTTHIHCIPEIGE